MNTKQAMLEFAQDFAQEVLEEITDFISQGLSPGSLLLCFFYVFLGWKLRGTSTLNFPHKSNHQFLMLIFS